MGNFRETLGINDLKAENINSIWRALLSEFFGNFLLNLFGCASVVASQIAQETDKTAPNLVMIAFTFGLTIFIVVQALGHVSGAHINPAVTAAMFTVGNITLIKAVLYIIVQCLGALAGTAVLKALTPVEYSDHNGGFGITTLSPGVTSIQGFGIEFFLGFVLVLTVCGVCDPNRPEAKAAGPLAIGLAVTLGHLGAIKFTGSSMNPARTFGSAVIAGIWTDHWVYWVGPILGGIIAALLYQNAFKAPSLGPLKIIERYTTVADERELKRLDGNKDADNYA